MELAVGGEMFGRIAERVGLLSPMTHFTLESLIVHPDCHDHNNHPEN